MRNTTLLLVVTTIAATSCSLQIDSQHGMRWEQRRPEQHHRSTDFKPIDAQAAASPVALESPASPSWSNTALPNREEYHAANAAPLIVLEHHYQAFSAPVPNERSTVRARPVSDDEHRKSRVLENHDKAQRNVLLKTLGVLLFILGAGISFISFILVYISIGFGGDLLGTLFIVLFLILGVFLVVLGRKMMRR
jgi:hypothetical protein